MEELVNSKTFKEYLFFWIGQLFSMLGSMVVFFVITWWIAKVYESEIVLAFTIFLGILVMTVSMPVAGVVADKFNRKNVILIADSMQAFLTFLLIVFFAAGIANITIVLVIIALRFGCQAFHSPTVNSIIPTMVPKDKLSRINGINFLFAGVVQLLAPFVGATMMFFLSIELILWVDIITFFVALIPLLLISVPKVNHFSQIEKSESKFKFLKEFKLGFKTLLLVPGLLIMAILSMLLNFLVTPINTLMPLFIIKNHNGGPDLYAYTEMFFTGGLIVGAILTSIKKNWNNKIRVIFISIVGAMIGYMIFAMSPPGSLLILGIGGVTLGFNLPIINSLYQTFLQVSVPADKLGRVSSIDGTLSSAISPIGTLISGPLAVFIGIPLLFFSCGFIGVAITIAFWSFTGIKNVDVDNTTILEEINDKLDNVVF
ncbi:MAG: MFS transporter [Candidatus Thorarchaeota archaeon]